MNIGMQSHEEKSISIVLLTIDELHSDEFVLECGHVEFEMYHSLML